MRSRISSLRSQATSLSSLYTSGQCFLSVLGSIGVILLFAGIPQIIYSAHVNPTNLLTFILGAMLVTLMVAGNAFIGHKYRQLIRNRREDRPRRNGSRRDDKPPSYDELVKQDGLPPEYEVAIQDKPPIYCELVHEVINWEAISSSPYNASCNTSCKADEEAPILAPVHRELERLRPIACTSRQSQNKKSTKGIKTCSNIASNISIDVSSQYGNVGHSDQDETVPSMVKFISPKSTTEVTEDEFGTDFIEIQIHDEETYF